MRGIRFRRTPDPVVELLTEQLQGALQIIAALVLTDEEVLEIQKKADPELREENMGGWAQGMKEDILSQEGREELVSMLRHQSFPCNTDRAFPLFKLSEAPAVDYELGKLFESLERKAVAYANGKGEKIKIGDSAPWIKFLLKKGASQETAEWIMKSGGNMTTNMAQLHRLRTAPSTKKA